MELDCACVLYNFTSVPLSHTLRMYSGASFRVLKPIAISQMEFVINHSEVKAIFVSGEFFAKVNMPLP